MFTKCLWNIRSITLDLQQLLLSTKCLWNIRSKTLDLKQCKECFLGEFDFKNK